jgi:hypothetical protein
VREPSTVSRIASASEQEQRRHAHALEQDGERHGLREALAADDARGAANGR